MSWMDDPKNWEPDSPAMRETFGEPAAEQAKAAVDDAAAHAAGQGDKTAREELEEELARSAAPTKGETPSGYTRDAEGRWHKPDGKFADPEEVEAIEALVAEERGEPLASPDAPAPTKTSAKTKQPIGDIVVHDAQGRVVPDLPQLSVTYSANGKALEKVPLDVLIRKAQVGEYNEAQLRDSMANRRAADEAKAAVAQLQQAVQQYEAFFTRALDDPQYYEAARQQRALANTPDAIIRQKDEQIAAIQRQQYQADQRRQGEAFYAQHIAPRISALSSQLPQDELTQKAFFGQVSYLINPLLINGQLPPDRLPEVVRIIDGALTPWAESLTQSRAATDDTDKQALRHQVEAAKVALALEKKRQARAIKPHGRAGPLREPPKPLPPPKSAEEANERLLASIEAEYGAR